VATLRSKASASWLLQKSHAVGIVTIAIDERGRELVTECSISRHRNGCGRGSVHPCALAESLKKTVAQPLSTFTEHWQPRTVGEFSTPRGSFATRNCGSCCASLAAARCGNCTHKKHGRSDARIELGRARNVHLARRYRGRDDLSDHLGTIRVDHEVVAAVDSRASPSGRVDACHRLVDQQQKGSERVFKMLFGRVLFLAVRKASGGLGKHHDDRHMRHHLCGVVQRA
jgi:hypothetical protein